MHMSLFDYMSWLKKKRHQRYHEQAQITRQLYYEMLNEQEDELDDLDFDNEQPVEIQQNVALNREEEVLWDDL